MTAYFSWYDLSRFLALVAYLGIISWSAYLPLLVSMDKDPARRLTVPLSFSFAIVLGYLFYATGAMPWFPTTYVFTGLIINIWALFLLIRRGNLRLSLHVNPFSFSLFLICAFACFAYAVTDPTPGGTDTASHIMFMKEILTKGHLALAYYAPGFHILLYPFARWFGLDGLYRFAGPLFGLIGILSAYWMFSGRYQHFRSRGVLLVLFSFPLLGPLLLQMIAFWPSSLSFPLLFGLLGLLLFPEGISRRLDWIVSLFFTVALSLTTPYLYLQYTPLLTVLWIGMLFARRRFPTFSVLRVGRFLLLAIFGLIIAFTHVIYENHKYTPDAGFPEISFDHSTAGPISDLAPTNRSVTIMVIQSTEQKPSRSWLKPILNNQFVKESLLPSLTSVEQAVRPKGVRPISLSGAQLSYAWIAILLLGVLPLAWYSSNVTLFLLTLSCLCFGIFNQTGIFEIGDYRGRSSWYFMALTPIVLAGCFDLLYRKRYRVPTACLISAMSVVALAYPPLFFYNSFSPILYRTAYTIIQQHPRQDIRFISTRNLSLLSQYTTQYGMDPASLEDDQKPAYLFFEKNSYSQLPSRYRETLANNPNTLANARTDSASFADLLAKQDAVRKAPVFKSFHLYFEDKDTAVYGR